MQWNLLSINLKLYDMHNYAVRYIIVTQHLRAYSTAIGITTQRSILTDVSNVVINCLVVCVISCSPVVSPISILGCADLLLIISSIISSSVGTVMSPYFSLSSPTLSPGNSSSDRASDNHVS